MESFFTKSQKLPSLAKMAIFWHVWPNLWKMRIFHQNGICCLLTLIVPITSCQVLKKSLERFPRSIAWLAEKGEIIELVAFAVSIIHYFALSLSSHNILPDNLVIRMRVWNVLTSKLVSPHASWYDYVATLSIYVCLSVILLDFAHENKTEFLPKHSKRSKK